MTDDKLEQLRQKLREGKVRKQPLFTDDPSPEELRERIPDIMATLKALDEFKRRLLENNVPDEVYPVLAASVMEQAMQRRHPEETRWLTQELMDHVSHSVVPVRQMRANVIGIEDNALLCPNCNGNYLHHRGVVVYDREEDAETLTKTEVADGVSTSRVVPSVGSGNPSARRDGLAVRFWCELCEATAIELMVEQHKGQTFLAWRYAVPDYQMDINRR